MSGPKISSLELYNELRALNRRLVKLVAGCKTLALLLEKEKIDAEELRQYIALVEAQYDELLPFSENLSDTAYATYAERITRLEQQAPDVKPYRKRVYEAQRARWGLQNRLADRKEPAAAEAQPSVGQQEVLQRIALLEDRLHEMPSDAEAVSAARRRLDEIRRDYAQSPASQMTMLRQFETFQLPQVEKEARLQARRNEYEALCALCGLTPSLSKGDAGAMEAACADMQAMLCRRKQDQFVQHALDETMKEMGYGIMGASQDGDTQSFNKLYRLQGDAVLNVVYASNGQVTMQVGKASQEDRKPEKRELPQMVADMRHFCTQYPRIRQLLAQKGLTLQEICLLPPTEDFAQMINTTPFAVQETGRRRRELHREREQKKMYLEE